MTLNQIAKQIRKDIGAAKQAGVLPKDLKVAIHSRSSPGISLEIQALGDRFVYNPAHLFKELLSWQIAPNLKLPSVPRLTSEAMATVEALKKIAEVYETVNPRNFHLWVGPHYEAYCREIDTMRASDNCRDLEILRKNAPLTEVVKTAQAMLLSLSEEFDNET